MKIRRIAWPFVLSLGGLAVAAQPSAARTVRVDCTRGERIAAALRSPGAQLTVEIRGLCSEDVVVLRSNVTLRGGDPGVDGIESASPTSAAALTVRRSRNVRVESVKVTGPGLAGIVVDGAQLTVSGSQIRENGGQGILANSGSIVQATSTIVSDNTGPAFWVFSSRADCRGCTLSGPAAPYSVIAEESAITLEDSAVTGGALVEHASDLSARSSSFSGAPQALVVGAGGTALVSGGSLDGSFLVEGGHLTLFSVQQTSNPSENRVWDAGFADIEAAFSQPASSLVGTTSVQRFGRAVATGGTALGALVCGSGGDLWCDATVTRSASTCGSCP